MDADPGITSAAQDRSRSPAVIEARNNAIRAMFRARSIEKSAMQRWLSRHPGDLNSDSMQQNGAADLSTLLWAELQKQERVFLPDVPAQPPGDAVQYWTRRRRIAQFQRWMSVVSNLPVCWHRLANAGSEDVKKFASAIGFAAISGACRGRASEEIIRWLAPLGRDLATRVITDAVWRVERNYDKTALIAWRGIYDSAASFFRGAELQTRTGYLLLASMLDRLSQAHRLALGRAARSTLFESVGKLPVVPLPLSAVQASEDIVTEVLAVQAEQSAEPETELDSVELTLER